MSVHVLVFLLIVFVTFTSCSGRRVILTPLDSSVDGATVSLLHDTTINPITNEWEVNCTSRRYFALQISLDASWQFHATVPSNITFRMNSATSTETNTDLELILAFSGSSNANYWSTKIVAEQANLNNANNDNQIGPQCDTHVPPLNTSILFDGDVRAKVDGNTQQRDRDDVSMPRKHEWQPIEHAFYFPLQITMQHDQTHDAMYVYHMQANYTQKCGFAETLATEQGLQIYFHVDEVGESVSVQSFEIEYHSEDADVVDGANDNNVNASATAIIALTLALVCSCGCIAALIYDRKRATLRNHQASAAQRVKSQSVANCKQMVTVSVAANHAHDRDQEVNVMVEEDVEPEPGVGSMHQRMDSMEETEEESADISLMYDRNLKLESERSSQRTRRSSRSSYPPEGKHEVRGDTSAVGGENDDIQ